MPDLRPYDLRHYFISHAVMSGVATLTIAKWVGHRNTKMIEEVYAHLAPKFRAEQMQKVNIGIGEPPMPTVAPSNGECRDGNSGGANGTHFHPAGDGKFPVRIPQCPENCPETPPATSAEEVRGGQSALGPGS